MDCPVCDITLVISSRESIEIDYCPQCRGVWLDRGELDKIIERATPTAATAPVAETRGRPDVDERSRWEDRPREDRPRRDDRDRDDDWDRRPRRKKRGGFLEELFDFD